MCTQCEVLYKRLAELGHGQAKRRATIRMENAMNIVFTLSLEN